MKARCGSHALAVGPRPGSGGGPESGVTALAGFETAGGAAPESGGSLHWPVLLEAGAPKPPVGGWQRPQPSSRARRSPGVRRFPSRCVAAASPAVPTRSPGVAFLRSRHCSRRGRVSSRRSQCPGSVSLAGFQTSLIGRFWASPEGGVAGESQTFPAALPGRDLVRELRRLVRDAGERGAWKHVPRSSVGSGG